MSYSLLCLWWSLWILICKNYSKQTIFQIIPPLPPVPAIVQNWVDHSKEARNQHQPVDDTQRNTQNHRFHKHLKCIFSIKHSKDTWDIYTLINKRHSMHKFVEIDAWIAGKPTERKQNFSLSDTVSRLSMLWPAKITLQFLSYIFDVQYCDLPALW